MENKIINSQNRHVEVWNNCLRIIEQIVDAHHFNVWFKPIVPISMNESTLTVEVPSDFFREFLEDSFLDVIKKTLRRVIGADARLVYNIRPVKNQPPMQVPIGAGPTAENRETNISIRHDGGPGPFVYPGVARVKINPRLNKDFCFSRIVEGECNKMAVSTSKSIAAAPGRTPFNPIFIFGGPGLGKTLVAQSIGNEVLRLFPDKIVLYVTGNEFKNQYMDAVNVRNKLTDFMAYYQKIDVLIVDDIQDLSGQGSQAAFFNIFNYLHQNCKQLIFTSDRAPVDLKNFEERLLSRFKWGLSVELGHPDYQTRLKALREKCFREGVQISDEVLEYLAAQVKTNFRELEGALVSVIAHSTMLPGQDPLELAKHITSNIVSEVKNEVTIDSIQFAVCEYFNITRDDMVSKSRRRQFVQARQIAMYLCRNMLQNCSLATIGAEIGGKDHATVLHACTTVQDLMSTDRLFKKYVNDIEAILAPVR